MGTLDEAIDAEPTFERVEMVENDANTRDVFLASYDTDRLLDQVIVMTADSAGSVQSGAVDIAPGNSMAVAISFGGVVDVEPSASRVPGSPRATATVPSCGCQSRNHHLGIEFRWYGCRPRSRGRQPPHRGHLRRRRGVGRCDFYGPGSAVTGQGTTAALFSTTGSGDTDGVLVRYNP